MLQDSAEYQQRQAGSLLSAASANPVLRLTSPVDGPSHTSPAHPPHAPVATIQPLKPPPTPGASSLPAAPSIGLPPRSVSPALVAASASASLPSLAKYHTESDDLSSSPEHRRTDSSVYYTTAWGSPYATPSPRLLPSASLRSYRGDKNPNNNNTSSSRESSPSSTKSTHPKAPLRTSNNQNRGSLNPTAHFSKRFYGSIGRNAAARGRQGKTIKDFTEEWINQYLSGQPRTERTNWLSDDSGSETGSFLTARNYLNEDDGWLGLEDDDNDEDNLKTPTSKSFLGSVRDIKNKGKSKDKDLLQPPKKDGRALSKPRPKHIPKKSTDTLKQSDFWDFGADQETTAVMSDKENPKTLSLKPGSTSGDSSLPISPIDKPLPPPPTGEQNNGASHPLPASPLVAPKLSRTATPSFQRPRKTIRVRGKACVIALPLDDRRGLGEGGIRLLTPADIEDRLKRWEDEGYSTNPYNFHDEHDSTGGSVQSRPAFPDAHESQSDWQQKKYNVSFPDQSVWEAYVNFLKEEKLRALGVFLGDPEPTSAISQGSVQVSQASTPFPGHTFSPPIPTSSAASNPFGLPTNAFSAPFSQPGIPSSTPGGFASPASPFGLPTSSSFPGQPGILGADQGFNQGFPFLPFQPTPPTQGSFTPPNFFVARQGGVSPVGSTNLPNLNSLLPPVSPLTSDDAKQFPGTANLLSNFNSGPLPTQSQQSQQEDSSQLISPLLDGSTIEIEADSDTIDSSGPEIAHPTPRGHRHNVSETLQKGVESAEYHLEDSIRRQLEEDDKQPTDDLMKSRWAVDDSTVGNNASKTLPQQRLFCEQDEEEDEGDLPLDGSDIDTNPSLSGSFSQGQFGDSAATSQHQVKASESSFTPRHRSRTSVSTLNVEAKEFDPSGAFASNTFSFTGNSFQPASTSFPTTNSIFSPNMSTHSAASSSGFNVTAPAFAPGSASKRDSISSNTNSNFKFSATSFNIDAPVFNPGRNFTSEPAAFSGSDAAAATPPKSKIFSGFDSSSLIVKPARRSKAIPIVRPDENAQKPANEREHVEDESGRIGRGFGREKRARRGGSDGDMEAVFAVPGNALAENAESASLNVPAPTASSPSADGKENAVPEEKVELEKEVEVQTAPAAVVEETTIASTATTPVAAAPENLTPISKDTPVSQTAEWSPYEFKNGFEAAAFNASFPLSPGVYRVQQQARTDAKEQDASVPTPAKEEAAEKPKSSVLKPTAPAFEFKPAIQAVAPAPVSAPAPAPAPPKKASGLEASRYAVSSPPSSPPVAYRFSQASPAAPESVNPEEEETLPLSEVEANSSEDADHDSLDAQEIDAVMRVLNDKPELGIERYTTPQPQLQGISGAPHLAPSYTVRSNAPSPSVQGTQRLLADLPRLNSDFDGHMMASPQRSVLTGGASSLSPIRHLNNPDHDEHISDWDDAISSGEDIKLQHRSRFFDRHVNEIVGGILENRLDPLERTLSVIQQSIGLLASRSVSQARSQQRGGLSAEVEDSDADDEDEEEDEMLRYRSRSPLNRRDRRVDKIKSAVLEALANHPAARKEEVVAPPAVDLSEIQNALAELKTLAAAKLEHEPEPAPVPEEPPLDLKKVIVDAISEHPRLNAPVETTSQKDNIEALKMQVDGLQTMLRVADERAETEYQTRRDAQDSLSQCQRLLRVAEDDAAQHRESAMKAEEALRDLKERKLPETEQIEKESKLLREQQEGLTLTLSELSDKNIALSGTLDEYRLSADNWRTQVEEGKAENKDLRMTIAHLKSQIEDSMRARAGLRGKFERLQDDMVTATRDIARDQAVWRKKEEDMSSKYNTLRNAYDREVKLREKLELDIGDLQQQEKEATKLRFIFGQSQQENARLEELTMTLRQESHDYQTKAARFEREFNEARESSHIEIQRARTAMEAELDAANNQVNYVRAELESQITSLQNQLDSVRLDADTAKARHELQLEEATDAKRAALAEAAQSKDNALQEQRLLHERGLNDLRERHARALHNSSEDRQRGESHLLERLTLRDEKIKHLEDKFAHAEEKLEIAKSAARAAAQAAQSAKTTPVPAAAVLSPTSTDAHHPTSPSLTYRANTSLPEKISPQALRESIMVLQDQLQQREGRIEELEHELDSIDKDAPAKVKERETEISWLRELLGVRVDDLTDLINTLSAPEGFRPQSVRDAAIRLRANLQMEMQEKERAMTGGIGGGVKLPSLSSIAASPRSLPLAAAAAWGNWRKAREGSVSSPVGGGVGVGAEQQRTPSKRSNINAPNARIGSSSNNNANANGAPSFLSGLLTPPSSNVRISPATYSAPAPVPLGRRTYSESRPLRGYNNPSTTAAATTTPNAAAASGTGASRRLSSRQMEKRPQYMDMEPPTTPPLLRQSSYDRDAEARYDGYAEGGYSEEEEREGDEEESVLGYRGVRERGESVSTTVVGEGGVGEDADGPFGPVI
ncbi:hypothetical protein FQN52_001239 [Onygenales sp. PD_12]|nr:hypothetical protein FQN52_001239 [Onygenales sp. PD_12]